MIIQIVILTFLFINSKLSVIFYRHYRKKIYNAERFIERQPYGNKKIKNLLYCQKYYLRHCSIAYARIWNKKNLQSFRNSDV